MPAATILRTGSFTMNRAGQISWGQSALASATMRMSLHWLAKFSNAGSIETGRVPSQRLAFRIRGFLLVPRTLDSSNPHQERLEPCLARAAVLQLLFCDGTAVSAAEASASVGDTQACRWLWPLGSLAGYGNGLEGNLVTGARCTCCSPGAVAQ